MIERDLANVVPARKQQRRMSLRRLAARQIVRIPLIPIGAFALETPHLIQARLRADARLQTLVHIDARPSVRRQPIARITFAIVTLRRVDALVRTAAVLHATLVHIAAQLRLVLAARTVHNPIAHLRRRNAHAIAAIELRAPVALPALRTLRAVQLVAGIGALGDAVAHQMAGDAGAILALELIGATGGVAARIRLVVAVRTVGGAVAHPRLVDARDAILALELTVQATVERYRYVAALCCTAAKHRILVCDCDK